MQKEILNLLILYKGDFNRYGVIVVIYYLFLIAQFLQHFTTDFEDLRYLVQMKNIFKENQRLHKSTKNLSIPPISSTGFQHIFIMSN